jgi:hypothetical protein
MKCLGRQEEAPYGGSLPIGSRGWLAGSNLRGFLSIRARAANLSSILAKYERGSILLRFDGPYLNS